MLSTLAGISRGNSAAVLGEGKTWANRLTSLFSLLIGPELSASDDSSLSDGLLLEEGEMGSLGTQARLWAFAQFPREDSRWDQKVQVLMKAGVPARAFLSSGVSFCVSRHMPH